MSSAMRTLWQLPDAAVPYTVKFITKALWRVARGKPEFDTGFANLYLSYLRRFADSLAGAGGFPPKTAKEVKQPCCENPSRPCASRVFYCSC